MSKLVRRLPALAAAVLIAVLVVSGCGGKSSKSDAQTLLKETFSGPHRVDSARLALALAVTTGGKNGLDLKLSGPFERGRSGDVPKLALRLSARSPKRNVDAGVTTTATQFFVRQGGQDYVLPQAAFSLLAQSYRSSAEQSAGKPLLGRLGVALKWLRDPRLAGDTDVGGTPTRHITSAVDVKALLGDLGSLAQKAKSLPLPSGQLPDFSPEQSARLEKAVKTSSVDVYTGKDDKTLRRLIVHLKLEAAAQSGSGAALPPTEVTFSVELAGLNQPQTITAPANAKPLSKAPGGGGLGGFGGLGGT